MKIMTVLLSIFSKSSAKIFKKKTLFEQKPKCINVFQKEIEMEGPNCRNIAIKV